MMPVRGEALGVVTNWPPSLEAALQRWGTISPKAPCLTSLDTAGKPLYVLTYGNQTLLMSTYSSESWTVLWSQDSGLCCILESVRKRKLFFIVYYKAALAIGHFCTLVPVHPEALKYLMQNIILCKNSLVSSSEGSTVLSTL